MKQPQRPDAWFVRTGRGGHTSIFPCTRQGWAVTTTYSLFVLAITPIINPPTPFHVAVWLILFAAATTLFLTVTWRTSSPAVDDSQKGNR